MRTLTKQVEKTGGPEVNTLQEIPVPTPKDDEVLIKVQWTYVFHHSDNPVLWPGLTKLGEQTTLTTVSC